VLRVTLVGKKSGREISARALLDSGAEGIIIDEDFARRNKLTLSVTVSPSPQSKDEENEKLHKLREYARDFRRQHTTDAEQFDCLVIT
jgi:hypothetical protein